ncbi:MAG: DNA alkylation repair protein [Acetobacter sp.]|nr:DNA alkylation repair protein [Acetobacter sp.]
MHTEVLSWLKDNAEERYRQFSARLLPSTVSLLGVRIPTIRKYAKSLIKAGRGKEYLDISPNRFKYQEELMLYALVLANIKIPTDEKISQLKKFLPFIDSWAICDIFCADLKEVKKSSLLFYDTFKSLLNSEKEYEIRFFYVLALNYFIIPEYMDKIFNHLAEQKYVGFYDKMAAAWLISVAYVKFPTETEKFLFNTPLDSFVFKKSISKICDSFRVNKEAKIHLRTLASTHKP